MLIKMSLANKTTTSYGLLLISFTQMATFSPLFETLVRYILHISVSFCGLQSSAILFEWVEAPMPS